MQSAVKLFVFLALGATMTSGSPSMPIWELLTHKEKMGRLMYVFNHLVHNYCRGSNIPDCNKVLTLYGMSNLVNEDDDALNRMDPYQYNSRTIIWEKFMRGDFKLFTSESFYSKSIAEEVQAEEDYDSINEIDDSPSSYQVNQRINKLRNDPHPYAVRVPAPDKMFAAHATKMTTYDLVTSDFDKIEDNTTHHSDIDAENAVSDIPRSTSDPTEDSITDNSDMTVGSSHPYAVKVLPASSIPHVGIKATIDYEPMIMESKVHETHILSPTLVILKGK